MVVTCSSCGRANADDAAFCAGCGTPLDARACTRCGRPARADDRFCAGCGAPLEATDQTPQGQRRHLTVMFSDLADSTRLAGELDPEDMRDLYRAYQAACSDAIVRHSGYLAQFMGDGILAYFGYPEAHEDDARLAVTAGLEIVAAAAGLRARLGRDDIAVRVGIHTGEVVVAAMGGGELRQEHSIVGETPNVAARLQSAAGLDCVIISGDTRVLVEGWFELEDMGAQALKGVSRPIPAYRARRSTAVVTRLDAEAYRGLTPLAGRGRELAELLDAWSEASTGDGRVVLLSGEPGIGKSRLAHELHERVRMTGHRAVRLRCSPYHRNSPLFPLLAALERVVPREADEETRRAALDAELERCGLPVDEAGALLYELLA